MTLNSSENVSVYDQLGGIEWFSQLCDGFYSRVANDEVLRPLYPEDLQPSSHWLALFLAQYWGGPGDYSSQRGHPRLRMRHMHFRLGSEERNRWYEHMAASLVSMEIEPALEQQMLDYFSMAASHLVNTPD